MCYTSHTCTSCIYYEDDVDDDCGSSIFSASYVRLAGGWAPVADCDEAFVVHPAGGSKLDLSSASRSLQRQLDRSVNHLPSARSILLLIYLCMCVYAFYILVPMVSAHMNVPCSVATPKHHHHYRNSQRHHQRGA